jgi:hypothetical protein
MPKYHLNALGDVEFEKMIQSLLKRVIGPGTTTFGAGADGAREATYEGMAPYPSKVEQWNGNWIFQAKFHDTELVGVGPARASVISDTDNELKKITTKYNYHVDNYILITNVPLSGTHGRGTLDRLESEVFSKYRRRIPHLKVWGADDVNRFLDLYPEVRRPYLPLLISGDIIAELLTQTEQTRSERAITIDMYLRTAMSREENAQLDQAGDVSEDAVLLQHVFFDLDAYIPSATRDAMERLHRHHPIATRNLPINETSRVAMVSYLVSNSAPDRTVIVGGPGEGKSTIGQYLAQLHRAALLDKADDIAISPEYVPETPRLPFRVVLKDFAQWLADNSAESSEGASLDTYISEQITKLSTRKFGEKDLHEVLKTNPSVLILDGLDEVTDAGVRRRLVVRLLEFLDRSQNVLHNNLQVIATTRPTNYSDQFDPKTFLHFRLHKLKDKQVRDYVGKWIAARVLEEDKAVRLQKTIEECLADNQISLLMTTPLQVTILILIINSGGTPPRQREAMFNDYLEVIYKREKAKGLGIVKTEKELLIGLHKFVGYLLHEEATKARTSSATLTRAAYDTIVMDYLRRYDPYSPPDHIKGEWHTITVDAGERLVLIVESPANIFGFELRSIQEFFAACYLSDTSSDTIQRYDRFARIAHLPHWRNVALFFAGRVGRNYPGEAANIIEVCKQIDRSGPDLFVKRGAEVALELAAERALGPNRVLQRSLLEHGLSVFDASISFQAREAAIELVERLPHEDVRDHILPVLEQRLPTLGYVAIVNACYLLKSVAPGSEVLTKNLIRLASEAGERFASDILTIISDVEIPSELRMQVVRMLLAVGVEPATIGEGLASPEWQGSCLIAAELDASDLNPLICQSFAFHTALNISYGTGGTADSLTMPQQDSPLAILLQCSQAIGMLLMARPAHSPGAAATRFEAIRRQVASNLPDVVKSGLFSNFSVLGDACWLPWLAHLALGEVTTESWERFLEWLASFTFLPSAAGLWAYLAHQLSPVATLIEVDSSVPDLSGLADTAAALAGAAGGWEWLERLKRVQAQLGWLHAVEMRKLLSFGPGVLVPDIRDRVLAVLDSEFDSRLQPIVLEWLNHPRPTSHFSEEDFDRLAEWFGNLLPDSPWRRRSLAGRAASRAVRLGRVRSAQFEIFVPELTKYVLQNIAVNLALLPNDEDLRFLLSLSQLGLSEYAEEYRYGAIVSPAERRQIILRLLPFVDDSDTHIHNAALGLIIGICLRASQDETPRSAIRSPQLDAVHNRLITSQDQLDRAAGIALYVVRPPRSRNDWSRIQTLLKSATASEVDNYWFWVLRHSADLAADPSLAVRSITSVLQDGVKEELALILTDVLRKVLPRETQSLSPAATELSLPVINFFILSLVSLALTLE